MAGVREDEDRVYGRDQASYTDTTTVEDLEGTLVGSAISRLHSTVLRPSYGHNSAKSVAVQRARGQH